MSQASVEISEYNPDWPLAFEREKKFLEDIVGEWLYGSIEHVGSTSVPGLAAKPVIDIMFGVKSLQISWPAIDVLVKNSYLHFPYKEDVMHWLCRPSDEYRTHHLHLIPFQSPLWNERIRFREILRGNLNIAKQYSDLKRALAVKYKYDRELYTAEKWPFINAVLDRARHA